MSSKERAPSNDKSLSGHQPLRLGTQNTTRQDQQMVPASADQKARLPLRLLVPRDVLQLQRTLGNRTVSRLFAEARHPHQSIQKKETSLPDNLKTCEAQGQDVFFRQGESEPDSLGKQKLIAHELTHVAQQNSGVVQRKIGDAENVIFGLSGRDKVAIQAAIDAGYTIFDGADTYGNTIDLLAEAIEVAALKGKLRADFEVIYKVDKTEWEDLESHLRGIATKLKGYIDHALIHKATATKQAEQYDPILKKLKDEGVIKKVGAGDVTANMNEHLAQKDSFEISAHDLFLAPDTDSLIEKLNKSGKPVFVYNIINTLKDLLGLGPKVKPDEFQVAAMVSRIKGKVPKAEPILSSGTTDTITANLNVFDIEDYDKVGKARDAIEEGAKVKNISVPIAEMEASVSERINNILYGGYNWGAESMFATAAEYEATRDEKLTQFTEQELAVRYQGNTKAYTLQQLIYMLFDSTGNCNRVDASTFLTS